MGTRCRMCLSSDLVAQPGCLPWLAKWLASALRLLPGCWLSLRWWEFYLLVAFANLWLPVTTEEL